MRTPDVVQWCHMLPLTEAHRYRRVGDWKLVIDGTHVMVFNVRADISERNELANRRQDVAARLRKLLAEWESEVDGEAKANQPPATTSW